MNRTYVLYLVAAAISGLLAAGLSQAKMTKIAAELDPTFPVTTCNLECDTMKIPTVDGSTRGWPFAYERTYGRFVTAQPEYHYSFVAFFIDAIFYGSLTGMLLTVPALVRRQTQ